MTRLSPSRRTQNGITVACAVGCSAIEHRALGAMFRPTVSRVEAGILDALGMGGGDHCRARRWWASLRRRSSPRRADRRRPTTAGVSRRRGADGRRGGRCRRPGRCLDRRPCADGADRDPGVDAWRRSGGVAVVGEPREIPDVATVLSSHARMHACEGEQYRRGLIAAANGFRLSTLRIGSTELTGRLATILYWTSARTQSELAAVRAEIGPPWQKDHKEAALAALAALHPYADRAAWAGA
jgi:hypothetical protein